MEAEVTDFVVAHSIFVYSNPLPDKWYFCDFLWKLKNSKAWNVLKFSTRQLFRVADRVVIEVAATIRRVPPTHWKPTSDRNWIDLRQLS